MREHKVDVGVVETSLVFVRWSLAALHIYKRLERFEEGVCLERE